MNTPPFHSIPPQARRRPGQDPPLPHRRRSRGYYYGTVIFGHRLLPDGFVPGGDTLIVEWDEPVPYLGRYSETVIAISDMPDPVWDPLDAWRETAAASFA